MSVQTSLRWFLAVLAVFAYAANTAQPHVRLDPGHTISATLCGLGGDRALDITIGGGPAEELVDTCCGDCTAPVGVAPGEPFALELVSLSPVRTISSQTYTVLRRTPLWPGAPPQGPPASHKA